MEVHIYNMYSSEKILDMLNQIFSNQMSDLKKITTVCKMLKINLRIIS